MYSTVVPRGDSELHISDPFPHLCDITHSNLVYKMAFLSALPVTVSISRTTRASNSNSVRACATPLNPDAALPMKEFYKVAATKKAPVCRCWKSKSHPLCDGSHNAYNKETGDNLGPLVVSIATEE